MAFPKSFQSGASVALQPPFAMIAFSAVILTGIAAWFHFTIDFAPTLNDIIAIYKIASLESAGRWTNGFYGPGYTLVYMIAGASFVPLAVLSMILMVISFVLVLRLTALLLNGEYILSIFITFIFYLFLFAVLKANYSDAIFVYLLFSGLALYLYGYFSEVRYQVRGRKRDMPLEILGLFIAGSTVLFRHHGLVFLLLFVTLLSIMGPARIGRFPFRSAVGTYSALLATFAGLFVLSLFVRDFQPVNWQNFNLYKFFYGVDWHRIDLLLDSPSYRQFTIMESLKEHPFRGVTQVAYTLYNARLPVLLLAGIPALGCIISNERFHLVVLLTVIGFTFIALPGLERGLYPLMLIVYLSLLLLLYQSEKTPAGLVGMILLLLAVGGSSIYHIISKNSQLQKHNRYLSEEMEPTLRQMGAEDAGTMFTDDYHLVLFSYNILDINNFQGWLNLHPEFRPQRPNMIFQEKRFDEHDIEYVVYLRNGYISKEYPDLPCVEQRTINKHHICKL